MRLTPYKIFRCTRVFIASILVILLLKLSLSSFKFSSLVNNSNDVHNATFYRYLLQKVILFNESDVTAILGLVNVGNATPINIQWHVEPDRQMNQDLFLGTFMLHLSRINYVLKPALQISSTKTTVPLVIGIPTIKREHTSYLIPTLSSLVTGMDRFERSLVRIVVLIAQPEDTDFVANVSSSVQSNFPIEIEKGLIEIIAAPKDFYPDLAELSVKPNRFNDNPERFKWRVKQNLDYAYLMAYSAQIGKYYLQLEDDVLASDGFVSKILCDVINKTDLPWLELQYSSQGFIGKLFRSADLAQFVQFILTFYEEMPVDWLLFDFISFKACRPDAKESKCSEQVKQVDLIYPDQLFTHIGKFSSLSKKTHKIAKLSETGITNNSFYIGYANPPANLKTSLETYNGFTLSKAYIGFTVFWALFPHTGDYILIEFQIDLEIDSYFFMSGNADHPGDIIQNASLEAKPKISTYTDLPNGFVKLADFTNEGVCQGSIPAEIGVISALQIRFHSDLQNWIILNEILLKTRVPTS